MKNSFIFLAIVLSSVVYPQSNQSNAPDSSVVLNGGDYSFAITIPAGWKLESGVGTWYGATAILYPNVDHAFRTSWGNPDAWVTVGISSKRSEGNQTLKNLLTFYAKVDSQEAATVSDQPNLVTKDKKTVLLKQKVRPDSYGAMALIDDGTFIAVFELRRFDEQQFNEALPKFRQIVESYRSIVANKRPDK